VNTVSENRKTEALIPGPIQYKYCGWEIAALMMYSYLYTRICCISHSVASINEFDCYHLCMGRHAVLLSVRVYRSIANITYRIYINTFAMFQYHTNYISHTSEQKSDNT
jgi:hypothetical protein